MNEELLKELIESQNSTMNAVLEISDKLTEIKEALNYLTGKPQKQYGGGKNIFRRLSKTDKQLRGSEKIRE